MDIFTRMIHGIRLKYAAVSVLFLAVSIALFYLGGPRAFGWYDFFAVFTLVLMVLTLFLIHCHYVIEPLEKMSAIASQQIAKTLDGTDPVRIPWNGKDEFACLAAALNGLLETVQSRSLGLLEENRRLKNVVASFDVEIVVMNGNGTLLDVVHCPPDVEPVPGLVRGLAPDPSVWSAENRRMLSESLKSACVKGEMKAIDLTFKSSGTNKTRRIRAVVKRANPRAFPVVFFRDMQKAASVPAGRKVPISRIAAGVSRDLQNVFSVIRNSAERYAGSERPEVRETVAIICDAISSGSAMMENLLTLGGEVCMDLRPVTVQELVDGIKPVVDGMTRPCGVRVEYSLSEGGSRVMADVRQINRVVEIVVNNSIEAFGAIPGRIAISTKAVELTNEEGDEFCPRQPAGRGLILRIEDDGPGISADIIRNAFEPYCSTKSSGRGLGLAIADSIVEAHGCLMRLDSRKGEYAAVEIFLRFSERTAEEADLLRKEFPGGEVLVVDDNRSVLKITAALLRTQKIAAHVADCRADALRKFGELASRIRAVFLDAQLGDETTVGLLKNMRSIDNRVPIIVVSGYSKGEIDAMFLNAPPDGYLMKPYTVSELQAILEKAKG